MDDVQLVMIDAESPLSEIVDLARRDIRRRAEVMDGLAGPLDERDVRALVAWGGLLNTVAKDHAKLFKDRIADLGAEALSKILTEHPVVEQARKTRGK